VDVVSATGLSSPVIPTDCGSRTSDPGNGVRKRSRGETIESLHVECYAGYRGEETPRAFSIGDCRIDIAQVLDQWLAPEHRYFKVADAAGDTYILRHDINSGQWELTMYKRPGSAVRDPGSAGDG
jgi:hypothetical protein